VHIFHAPARPVVLLHACAQVVFAARGALAGGGSAALKTAMAVFGADREGWDSVRAAVRAVCGVTPGPPPLPQLSSLLTPGHPWHRVASAVLACPAVKLTAMQRAMLSYANMGGVVTLWQTAQAARRASGAGADSATAVPVSRPALAALNRLCPEATHVGSAEDIPGVLCVLDATVSGQSILGAMLSGRVRFALAYTCALCLRRAQRRNCSLASSVPSQ
jgi:hypothetical protein